MIKTPLTRRQLARMALAGAGTLLAATASAQNTETTPIMPTATRTPDEGPFLAEAVPLSAGYGLTHTQAKEVAVALKDYPGAFGKARTYPIPDDVAPAWNSTPPPTVLVVGARKGRGK